LVRNVEQDASLWIHNIIIIVLLVLVIGKDTYLSNSCLANLA